MSVDSVKLHPPGTRLKIVLGGVHLVTAPVPESGFIARRAGTSALYKAEARVVDAVKLAAVAQARLHGFAETECHADFYDKAVPKALVAALDSFAATTAVAAAVAYLQAQGIAVDIEAADPPEVGT
jgi:hypothetical protein